MSAARTIAWAAALAASAATGWVARGAAASDAGAADTLVATPHRTAPARRALPEAAERPLIVVADDGRATLRVEQQPLDWVLEQIALQTGRTLPRFGSAVAAASAAAAAATNAGDVEGSELAAACPPPIAAADPARLQATLERGADAERLEALQLARSAGLALPEDLLSALVSTAPSEQLRLAAFEQWLEQRAGDPKAERAVLEAALLVPNATVQQEARQRLDDLTENERLDALAGQLSSP